MNKIYFTKMLLGCIIFTNKCLSKDSCRECDSSTFNNITTSDSVCLGDSKHISAIKIHLGPVIFVCQKDCDKWCEYYNSSDADYDPCLVSTIFCKMCGNKPRVDRRNYK